jgi:hypothetical protein
VEVRPLLLPVLLAPLLVCLRLRPLAFLSPSLDLGGVTFITFGKLFSLWLKRQSSGSSPCLLEIPGLSFLLSSGS